MSKSSTGPDGPPPHLDGLPDGAGCVEIWERLSADRHPDGPENAATDA